MKKRFLFETIVGVILFASIFLFGFKGIAAISLLALHPFIGKRKKDTNEVSLLNKIGNYTAGATLLGCIVVNCFSNLTIGNFIIGNNWFGLILSTFILSHGIFGVILFKNE